MQQTLNLSENKELITLDNPLFNNEEFFRSTLNKVGEPSTILFRKNLVKDMSYFREDLKQVLDYEFCYRVLNIHKIAIIEVN